jgi:bilirubin oxidase
MSDNRSFYIITNDGGLLHAPVSVKRVKMMPGERIEILVNLGDDAIGSSIDLKAYNSGQSFGFPGGEPATSGEFGSLLNNKDFTVLHINVAAATANPITSLPAKLANQVYWTNADVTNSRTINITGGQGGSAFTFDNNTYGFTSINQTVALNAVEKWTIVNNNIFGHSFHVHDVQFKIVARSSGVVGPHESGWKDTVYVPLGETVTVIAKFDDFADPTNPYMYHCHFSNHEDGGMMGQFLVTTSLETNGIAPSTEFSLYPNPATDKLFVNLKDASIEIYYVTIATIEGRVVMMLPQPEWQDGIDISTLATGTYTFQMMDKQTKSVTTKKFIKK